MRALRLIFIAIFALFGGPLPAAMGDHTVICGADGELRLVAYDFETGTPIEIELDQVDCKHCFSAGPFLHSNPAATSSLTPSTSPAAIRWRASQTRLIAGLPAARAPPFAIL